MNAKNRIKTTVPKGNSLDKAPNVITVSINYLWFLLLFSPSVTFLSTFILKERERGREIAEIVSLQQIK